jgi:hypothetical protein
VTTVPQYRNRPRTVEALQWDGSHESLQAICRWANDSEIEAGNDPIVDYIETEGGIKDVLVDTVDNGPRPLSPGDFVVKLENGNFVPYPAKVFHLLYEEAKPFERPPLDRSIFERTHIAFGLVHEYVDRSIDADDPTDIVNALGAAVHPLGWHVVEMEIVRPGNDDVPEARRDVVADLTKLIEEAEELRTALSNGHDIEEVFADDVETLAKEIVNKVDLLDEAGA